MSSQPEAPAPSPAVNAEILPKPGDSPKEVASKIGDAAAPAAGVTSGALPPGAPAVNTDTALPVASLANKEAANAGTLPDVCI